MRPARLISLTLLLTVSGLWCCGQVRVIGHVSAEVVESISASSNSNTDMSFNTQELKQFELGSFSLSGKALSTCALIINNANVSNIRGESFTIQTTLSDAGTPLVADKNGNRKLTLIAGTEELLANGQYQGNYGVTFAYN